MDEMTELLLGWVGALVVALLLVFGAALSLQSWHAVKRPAVPAVSLEAEPPTSAASSTWWSGRSGGS